MNNDTDIIIKNEHGVSEFHLNKLMIQRAKILLIDDEPLNTDLLAFSLEREYLVKSSEQRGTSTFTVKTLYS